MIELEKLYETAQTCLLGDSSDWKKFAKSFERVFGSKLALYRPRAETEAIDLNSTDEIIATTSPKMMVQYFADKIYLNTDLLKDPEIPFEPVRRTDSLTDDQLRALDIFPTFIKPHGIFHLMVNYAVLPDGTFLVLFVWRNDEQSDFSDIEKQRITLFMRHLAMIVGAVEVETLVTPNDALVSFGNKYDLTESEIAVLTSLIEGHSLRGIADKSERSYGTVRWHVRNLLQKCQVNTQQSLLSEFYSLITH